MKYFSVAFYSPRTTTGQSKGVLYNKMGTLYSIISTSVVVTGAEVGGNGKAERARDTPPSD